MKATEFAAAMAAFGPFEPAPHLAVAVSGGADSMALSLLADGWARRRGGRITALTIDHGLRDAAAGEARQCARWMAARGIDHHIMRWRGDRPTGDIQAAARAARYRLLGDWCARAGVLHLLVGHHRDDQAETFLLRLARGSGVDGLSAMAPVIETGYGRILRPLLNVSHAALAAYLVRRGQGWLDDPSNRDARFARARLRSADMFAREGLGPDRLAATAFRLGRARAALDGGVAALAARAAALYPAGYCLLDGAALAQAPAETGLRLLARALMSVSGAAYQPRLARLERLYRAVIDGGLATPRTLGGCRIVPYRGRLLVCREPAAIDALSVRLKGRAQTLIWDRRFTVTVPALRAEDGPHPVRLAGLGVDGWRQIVSTAPELRASAIPAPVRVTLPALWHGARLLATPDFFPYAPGPGGAAQISVRFTPPNALAGPAFAGAPFAVA